MTWLENIERDQIYNHGLVLFTQIGLFFMHTFEINILEIFFDKPTNTLHWGKITPRSTSFKTFYKFNQIIRPCDQVLCMQIHMIYALTTCEIPSFTFTHPNTQSHISHALYESQLHIYYFYATKSNTKEANFLRRK